MMLATAKTVWRAALTIRRQNDLIVDLAETIGRLEHEKECVELAYMRISRDMLEQFLIALEQPESHDEFRERVWASLVYRDEGLLRPPTRRDRQAFYGAEQLTRLRAVATLRGPDARCHQASAGRARGRADGVGRPARHQRCPAVLVGRRPVCPAHRRRGAGRACVLILLYQLE